MAHLFCGLAVFLIFFCLLTYGQEKTADLTLEEKVGQLLVFGYSGTKPENSLKALIDAFHPGGIVTFGRNITSFDQIRDLNQKAQEYSGKIPLLIMVDQEGGNVSRLKVRPPLPSALAIGQTGDVQLAEEFGLALGEFLKTLGFNMNLAPVLDLADPLKSTFVGPRSFGNAPDKVAELARAFARGQAQAGVAPTAKHFPGHGGISQDSHRLTPRKLSTLEELQKGDLKPFSLFAASEFPKAIMMAHLAFPQIDESGDPATFSHKFIRDILRGQLKFNDVIITDDVEMMGAEAVGSLEERVVRAIEAGNDMVMVAWSPDRQKRAYDALIQAVKSERISEARIDESVSRILALKKSTSKKPTENLFDLDARLAKLSAKIKLHNFNESASHLKNLNGMFSDRPAVTIFASDPRFHSQFKKWYGKSARFVRLTPESKPVLEQTLRSSKSSTFIYYASGGKTARWINQMPVEPKKRTILVNTIQAGAIENRQNYLGIFQLNTLAPEAGSWIAEFLTGPAKPRSPAQTD